MITVEQIVNTQKTNIDTFFGLTGKAFEGVEKLIELNLSAAKAAMDGLMRSIALEYGRSGITANSVAPGWIRTASSTDEELVAGEQTPVGRPGTPDEVAKDPAVRHMFIESSHA